MKVLVPLYVYPVQADQQLATAWQRMIEAREAGVSVVAVANPGSGPGTEGDRGPYEKGMKALQDGGVEVIGYVATGYGRRSENEVKADIDRYQEWYGQFMSGIFLDEAADSADDVSEGDRLMCARFRGYREHVQRQMGDSASVVMNTGSMKTEAGLTEGVGGDVVWNVLENNRNALEKQFGKATFAAHAFKARSGSKPGGGETKKKWKLFSLGNSTGGGKKKKADVVVEGTPPAAPGHIRGRAGFMMHGAVKMSHGDLCNWVNQLQDGGWSHIYLTDKVYDPTSSDPALHNPWDEIPTYWEDLVKSVGEVCGYVGKAK